MIDVDLCFLCDCTNTMDVYIQQVRTDITALVESVSSTLKAQLRVAFVAYRDYADPKSSNPEVRIESYDFTSDIAQFITFLQPISTDGGGGDRCEDVLGGMRASLGLDWKSPTKLLFHICDDPAHGTAYHSFFDDIEVHRQVLTEMLDSPRSDCRTALGADSLEFHWIFKDKKDIEARRAALNQYITSRQQAMDRFPGGHDDDPSDEELLTTMKERGIHYVIAKKRETVDKMIGVFQAIGRRIGFHVDTRSLTQCGQILDTLYHSISSAITISNAVHHTRVVQQSTRRLFMDSKTAANGHPFKVFCGIDFGTDGTAFSYCLPGDDRVYTPEWGDDQFIDTKLKTNILLDANDGYKTIAFGKRARDIYMNQSDDEDSDSDSDSELEPKPRLLFFERFKMALYKSARNDFGDEDESKTLDIHSVLTAVNGDRCSSMTVIVRALQFVKSNALEAISKVVGDVTVRDCQWTLTVPAIWSNRSKGIMRHCAAKAGLIDEDVANHLLIALEPDCASIGIQHDYALQRRQQIEAMKQKAMAKRRRHRQMVEDMDPMGQSVNSHDPEDWLSVNAAKKKKKRKIKGNESKEDGDGDPDEFMRTIVSVDDEADCKESAPKQSGRLRRGKGSKRDDPPLNPDHRLQSRRGQGPKHDDLPLNADHNLQRRSVFSGRSKMFRRGTKYILADLGGGTADIACHEILSSFNVREIYKASGGPFGSSYIDRAYIELLCTVIPRKWIEEFKQEEPRHFVALLAYFQNSKRNFWKRRALDAKGAAIGHDDGRHNVELPCEFITFIEDKIEYVMPESADDVDPDIDRMESPEAMFSSFCSDHIERGWLRLEDARLSMHHKVWRWLFDGVVDPICEHIEGTVEHLADRHRFDYLLLAGGFCESNYVRHRLHERFGVDSEHRLRIVVPRRPILQVVSGAALFSKNQCYVRSRHFRNTIGMEVRVPIEEFEGKYRRFMAAKGGVERGDEEEKAMGDGDAERERLLKLYRNDEYVRGKVVEDQRLSRWFVDRVFHRFVSAGDEIQIDDPPKVQYIQPVDRETNEIEIKLYEFAEEKSTADCTATEIRERVQRALQSVDLDEADRMRESVLRFFAENEVDGGYLVHRKRKEVVGEMVQFMAQWVESDELKADEHSQTVHAIYDHVLRPSNEEMRMFTDDAGCHLLASKRIQLPKEWRAKNDGSLDIPITFFFGDTEIRVFVGVQGLSQLDAEIALEYKYFAL